MECVLINEFQQCLLNDPSDSMVGKGFFIVTSCEGFFICNTIVTSLIYSRVSFIQEQHSTHTKVTHFTEFIPVFYEAIVQSSYLEPLVCSSVDFYYVTNPYIFIRKKKILFRLDVTWENCVFSVYQYHSHFANVYKPTSGTSSILTL